MANQIFHNYHYWEDRPNGQYNSKIEFDKVILCEQLLGDHQLLYKAMIEVIDIWVYATEQNLTDNSINKKARLGQAACCIKHGVGFMTTCTARWRLTDKQRLLANNSAKASIQYFKYNQNKTFNLFQDMLCQKYHYDIMFSNEHKNV